MRVPCLRPLSRFLSRSCSRSVPAVLAGACLAASPMSQAGSEGIAGTGGCAHEDVPRFRGGTARLENDLFAGTDRNYTNGVALTLVSHDMPGRLRDECLPAPARLHARLIRFLDPAFWARADDPATTRNAVFKAGQSMYTPEDHAATGLVTDDRPYAGLLYAGLAWNRRAPVAQAGWEMLDTREITLGVIGPWSLAEQSQDLVHAAMGSPRFLGWDHQLGSEPAFQLAMDRKFKRHRGPGAVIPGFSADAIHTVGLRLGNIETSAALGIEGRAGWNLPNDFGSYPIRPGAENRPPSSASLRALGGEVVPASRPRPGIHLFGLLEAKAVAWDFSLDGNLYRASHHVTRRPWVAQAAIGVSAQGIVAGRGYRLAVMRVHRTREFEEQGSSQAYGSIALSVEL